MFSPEEVVSYLDMCREKEVSLQRGMNYRLRGLMSRRKGAHYRDQVVEDGRVLIYEGRGGSVVLDSFLPTVSGSPEG